MQIGCGTSVRASMMITCPSGKVRKGTYGSSHHRRPTTTTSAARESSREAAMQSMTCWSERDPTPSPQRVPCGTFHARRGRKNHCRLALAPAAFLLPAFVRYPHAKVHRKMRSDDVGIRWVCPYGAHLVWTLSSLQLLDFVDIVTTKKHGGQHNPLLQHGVEGTHLQPNLTRILSSFCWTHLSDVNFQLWMSHAVCGSPSSNDQLGLICDGYDDDFPESEVCEGPDGCGCTEGWGWS